MISQSVPVDFTMVEHFGQQVCKAIPFVGVLETKRPQRGAGPLRPLTV